MVLLKTGLAQQHSPSAMENVYRVQFVSIDEVKVSANLFTRTGKLVMVKGFRPDARSANVDDLRVTSRDDAPMTATYEPQQARWSLAVSKAQPISVSYTVHLGNLRKLPKWAHLQYCLFDGQAAYFVTSCIFVAPDSIESTDLANTTIVPAPGLELAAPCRYDGDQKSYSSTVAGLVNNSFVIGKFSQVRYRHGDFSISVALLGKWAEQQTLLKRAIRSFVAQDLRLFPDTPAGRYLMTLASGDEDGQSFISSNSISTRFDINGDDTEVWANTIAHELFHHWNGWSIRTDDPRVAFFVEGFTEYFANRQILAASLIDRDRYWQVAARHLGSYSYFRYSPLFDVSIAEAGRNKSKNRSGVYDGGWTVALCLDLALRADSENKKSLDDLMTLLWQRYGTSGEPLTYDELIKAIGDVAGHDMVPFFTDYVTGEDELPFRSELARLGIAVYDQPFGGEAYIKASPHSLVEQGLR